MEISIRTNEKGRPEVTVFGSSKNTPAQIARAYSETYAYATGSMALPAAPAKRKVNKNKTEGEKNVPSN